MNKDENKGLEFDPMESEEFYNEIDKVLRMEEKNTEAKHIIETKESDFDRNIAMGFQNTTVEMLEEEDASMDEIFQGVSVALAEQIEKEFGQGTEVSASIEPKKEKNKFVAFWETIPTWTKVLASVILGILICVGLLFGTKPGQKLLYNAAVNFVFAKINVDKENSTPTIDPNNEVTTMPEFTNTPTPEETATFTPTPEITQEAEATPTNTPTPTNMPTLTNTPTPYPTLAVSSKSIKQDENIVNVLLLGEENIYGDSRGRTDAILVASLDKRTGQISLVSFLRDSYVRIPGYSDDRLNAAFSHGGARLVMDTIETNFRIKLDGYVKVNFSGFEKMIDSLGGLEISLTERESEYLNTTKYISKAAERNTVPGLQHMTGSQVLGYCRVRYVPTANGLQNDFGRTYRHRVVLQALLQKYKEQSLIELVSIMNNCFSYVTASESLKDIAAECLQVVVEQRNFDMQTLQIPKSGHYSGVRIKGKEVIKYNLDNVDIIQGFLYK